MTKYIARRLLGAVPLVVGIATIVFFAVNLAPGDPTARFISPGMSQDVIDQMRSNFGLDEPVHIRYVRWLGAMVTGDFGYSFSHSRPVVDVLAEFVPNTLILSAAALLVAYESLLPQMIGLTLISGLFSRRRAEVFLWAVLVSGLITIVLSGFFPALGNDLEAPHAPHFIALRAGGLPEMDLADSYGLIAGGYWWTALFPALAIATLVVGVNLIADGIQAVLER